KDDFRWYSDSLIFSPDARTLISVGSADVIRLWDVAAGKEIIQCPGPERSADSLAASADGKLLAAVHGNALWVWDLKSRKELFQLAGAAPGVPPAFTPDCKHLAYAHADHTVRLCDAASGKEVSCFRGHTQEVRTLTISRDGKTLFTASLDESLRAW